MIIKVKLRCYKIDSGCLKKGNGSTSVFSTANHKNYYGDPRRSTQIKLSINGKKIRFNLLKDQVIEGKRSFQPLLLREEREIMNTGESIFAKKYAMDLIRQISL